MTSLTIVTSPITPLAASCSDVNDIEFADLDLSTTCEDTGVTPDFPNFDDYPNGGWVCTRETNLQPSSAFIHILTPQPHPHPPSAALLTLFRIGSLDGWLAALSASQQVLGFPIVFLYVIIVVMGPCIVANICIANMISTFNKSLEEATAGQRKAHKESKRKEVGGGKKHGRFGHSKPAAGDRSSTWVCIPKSGCKVKGYDLDCITCYHGLDVPWLRNMALKDESWPNQVSNLAIVLNLVAMMMKSHGQSDAQTVFLEDANFVFTIFFAVELGLKLIILGPGDFFQYGHSFVNSIDAFVVTTSIIELLMSDSGGSLTGLRFIRMMRLAKLLRAGRITKNFPMFMKVLEYLQSTMQVGHATLDTLRSLA